MPAPARPEVEARIAQALDRGDLAGAARNALREYGPEILGYLCVVMRDDDQGHDAFSRFAEDFWKGLPTFRRQSTLRTWMYRVARNAAADERADPFRKRGRRLETAEISEVVAEVRSSSADYLKDAARERLEKLRNELSLDEQTLLILRVNRQLSWAEVAEVLTAEGNPVTEVAVRKQFQRLVEKLKKKKDEHAER